MTLRSCRKDIVVSTCIYTTASFLADTEFGGKKISIVCISPPCDLRSVWVLLIEAAHSSVIVCVRTCMCVYV